MNRPKDLQTKEYFDSIAVSVRNILFASFPGLAPQECEDIEQNVKLKIWQASENGKNIDNFRSYLWKVVYTTALDEIGKRMNCISLDELQARADSLMISQLELKNPEILAEAREMSKVIQAAVLRLSRRRKVVVELYLLGMDLAEISKFKIMRENQVRHLLYRGLDDLRAIIKKGIRNPKAVILPNLAKAEKESE
jgi:RNA polymerase sigma factor (sigma-70 family)